MGRKLLPGNPPQRELIDELFAQIIELPESEREEFIRLHCAGDHTVEVAVRDLVGAYADIGPFLELTADPHPRLIGHCSVGDLVAGDFEIRELLGAGGMGEVYLALDRGTHELVALKFIHSGSSANAEGSVRLRREARIRGLAHPNICPIYGLHRTLHEGAEISFLSMKYIPGMTVAEKLHANGPIPVGQALKILIGAAAGLDAAHAQGLVHRDLKPSNIMLSPASNDEKVPVILDFGLLQELAEPIAPIGEIPGSTQEGVILGSPHYMAPEQFLFSTVTAAADIYALAIIAFELVCGVRPFPAEGIIQTAVRRQSSPETAIEGAPATLPPNWRQAILQGLHPDPLQRPSTAGEFVEKLRSKPIEKHLAFQLTRRQLLIAGISVATMSGFALLYRYIGRWPRNSAPSILMLSPVISSGNRDLASAAGIATLLLRTQLTQSSLVTLLDQDRIDAAWNRMTGSKSPSPGIAAMSPMQARQIALRSNCHELAFATLTQTGDEQVLRLHLEILGDSQTSPLTSKSQDFPFRHLSDLPEAVSDAARWTRAAVGESAASIASHDFRPEDLTTPSWEALKSYAAADAEWRQSRNSSRAVLDLKNALAIDSEFPAASIRLADIFMATTQPDEAYAEYDHAVKILTARNLTDRESLRARGLFQLDVGFCQDAVDTFSRYASEYPTDPLPRFYGAAALSRLGRAEAAESLYSSAIKLAPDNYFFLMGRVRLFAETNRLVEAQRDWNHCRSLADNGWTDQMAMAIAVARGDLSSAAEAIRRLRTSGSQEFQSKSFALEACLLAEQNQPDNAQRALTNGLLFDLQNNVPVSNWLTKKRLSAQLYLQHGNRQAVLCACSEILAKTSGNEVTLQAACLLAQLGETRLAELAACNPHAAARQLAASCPDGARLDLTETAIAGNAVCGSKIPSLPIYRYWQLRLEIEIALARGDLNQAEALSSQVPVQAGFYITPDYLPRIMRSRRSEMNAVISSILKSPGRWWLEPERSAPGLLSLLRSER